MSDKFKSFIEKAKSAAQNISTTDFSINMENIANHFMSTLNAPNQGGPSDIPGGSPSKPSGSPIANKKTSNFVDETSFDFSLTGGPKCTELLMATAFWKSGPLEGQPLALQCQWFSMSPAGDLYPIEGVTGAFYQPCADDVGNS
jgi:hypothetical protein